MKESELMQIFLIISNYYNGFAYDGFKVNEWLKLLNDIPFEQAMANLRKYTLNPANSFPPHPGILAETSTQIAVGPYVPGVEETRLMLDKMDQQSSGNRPPIPEFVHERMKSLGLFRPTAIGTNESISNTSES
ncbi:MAG: hypothetical protein JWM44_1295 [Bacilli bacterium]|nr:hypothetical protein [Bacilli bacterium]